MARRRAYSAAERSQLWERWKRGESVNDIARALDRVPGSIYYTLCRRGGVRIGLVPDGVGRHGGLKDARRLPAPHRWSHRLRSARVAAIGNGTMTDCGDADSLLFRCASRAHDRAD